MAAQVPNDGPVQIGSVELPVGSQLFGWDDDVPRLWATSKPIADAGRVWQELADMHPDTGLVPILLAFLNDGHEGRPWDEGELNDRCDLASVDRLDAATVLAQSWAESLPDPEDFDAELAEQLAPYGREFPGLAPGQDRPLSDAELASALGCFGAARIGLVPASRPADVLALVGFNGTVNRYNTPELLSAALRSWEDRFGAVLVEAGFAHIRLLIQRPPRTLPEAQAVAAELWAFSDEFWPIPKSTALHDIGPMAERILDVPIWSLWLD